MSVHRSNRHRLLVAVVALALVVVGHLSAAGADGPRALTSADTTPVRGLNQAYHPGSMNDGATFQPSSAIPDYAGEYPVVQATAVGRRALEPTVGVDSKGNAFFAASWHGDAIGQTLPVTHIRATLDGGATWQDVTARLPVGGQPNPPLNADPYVFVDPVTDRVFQPEAMGGCLYINSSDDAGKTWSTNPLACGNGTIDHPGFTAGPFPKRFDALRTTYPNVVYYCSNQLIDAMCNRSLDGGIVWTGGATPAFPVYEPAERKLCGGMMTGHPDTDSHGRVFVPKGHCGEPWLAVSDDLANTWTRVRVSDMRVAETHIAVATDDADNVYVLWWDRELRLPWLAISTDHGRTFGKPMMVAPPGVREVNFPVLDAGEPGKVAIVFPGTTYQRDYRRPWNYYTVVTTNALDDNPTFVSTTANEPANPIHRGNCGPGRCPGMFDFIDITISPLDGGFWATLSDTCEATACTRPDGVQIDMYEDRSTWHSGVGYAIRQVGGPRVRTPKSEPAALP